VEEASEYQLGANFLNGTAIVLTVWHFLRFPQGALPPCMEISALVPHFSNCSTDDLIDCGKLLKPNRGEVAERLKAAVC